MMRNKIFIMHLLVLLIMVTSSGCQPAAEILPTPTNTIEAPTPTATRVPPSCPNASSFGYFTEIYPSSFQLKSTSPEFEWRYLFKTTNFPGSVEGWVDVCVPESYTLYFSSGPDFSDEISVQVTEPNLTFFPTYLAVRWVITPALQPFTVYRWLATGHYGNIHIKSDYVVADKIPQLHSDSFWPPENTHRNIGVFVTGPICDTLNTGIPILDLPADEAVITSLQPTFTWHVSDCMPEAFNINISRATSPEMSPDCVNSNDPADFAMCINQQNPWLDMETYAYNPVHLLDCSDYMWRVRPVIWFNEVMEVGDWSASRSFHVDSGACVTPTPTFIPWTPTPTQKPTSVPQPTGCDYATRGECEDHSQCEWYEPATEAPHCRKVQ